MSNVVFQLLLQSVLNLFMSSEQFKGLLSGGFLLIYRFLNLILHFSHLGTIVLSVDRNLGLVVLLNFIDFLQEVLSFSLDVSQLALEVGIFSRKSGHLASKTFSSGLKISQSIVQLLVSRVQGLVISCKVSDFLTSFVLASQILLLKLLVGSFKFSNSGLVLGGVLLEDVVESVEVISEGLEFLLGLVMLDLELGVVLVEVPDLRVSLLQGDPMLGSKVLHHSVVLVLQGLDLLAVSIVHAFDGSLVLLFLKEGSVSLEEGLFDSFLGLLLETVDSFFLALVVNDLGFEVFHHLEHLVTVALGGLELLLDSAVLVLDGVELSFGENDLVCVFSFLDAEGVELFGEDFELHLLLVFELGETLLRVLELGLGDLDFVFKFLDLVDVLLTFEFQAVELLAGVLVLDFEDVADFADFFEVDFEGLVALVDLRETRD